MPAASARAVNDVSSDAAYYRMRARKLRHAAKTARDAVILAELLRLAEVFQRMAVNAEIQCRARRA